MDVIASLPKVTETVKVCYAYKNKFTGGTTYSWPYDLSEWEPLYAEMTISDKEPEEIIADYIDLIQLIIGHKITGYGVGPTRKDYRER